MRNSPSEGKWFAWGHQPWNWQSRNSNLSCLSATQLWSLNFVFQRAGIFTEKLLQRWQWRHWWLRLVVWDILERLGGEDQVEIRGVWSLETITSIKWDEIDVMRNRCQDVDFDSMEQLKKKRGDESEWCVEGGKDLWKLTASYGTWKGRGWLDREQVKDCLFNSPNIWIAWHSVYLPAGISSTCRMCSGKTKIVPGFKPACHCHRNKGVLERVLVWGKKCDFADSFFKVISAYSWFTALC